MLALLSLLALLSSTVLISSLLLGCGSSQDRHPGRRGRRPRGEGRAGVRQADLLKDFRQLSINKNTQIEMTNTNHYNLVLHKLSGSGTNLARIVVDSLILAPVRKGLVPI